MNGKPEIEYWFNLKTLQVERGLLTPAPYRVGPFKTAEEAAQALKLIADRSKVWREDEEKD